MKFKVTISQYASIAYYHEIIVSAKNEDQAGDKAMELIQTKGVEYDEWDYKVNDGWNYQIEDTNTADKNDKITKGLY